LAGINQPECDAVWVRYPNQNKIDNPIHEITHIDGTPTQQRNAIRRTIAEILRRLMDKRNIDDETKDMLAFIVFGLRSMDQSIDQSATAWEKRDYYLKADQFRREWLWLPDTAKRLEEILRSGDWTTAPIELAGLSARFSDVKVTTYTKPPALWQDAYKKLLASPNGKR
jgi:hypothetical protein